MKPTIHLNRKMLGENLVDYLLEKQRPFAGTQAYEELCNVLMEYLNSSGPIRKEKHAAFVHAKAVFEHLCDTTEPPGDPQTSDWSPQKEKLRYYSP
jgi:hypothetical protein